MGPSFTLPQAMIFIMPPTGWAYWRAFDKNTTASLHTCPMHLVIFALNIFLMEPNLNPGLKITERTIQYVFAKFQSCVW
uniref:Uncharacterized protein n=1 Tax=mine drainage metagenome TaxID=410659 RepID=E6QT13_9ZZZZ